MAVGKTTAVDYLRVNAPYVNISYEDNADVIAEIRGRGLRQSVFEDYVEIQRLWLRKEIIRWEKAAAHRCSIMDFGAEEIEFFTLNYPKSIGLDWDVEAALHAELAEIRTCLPHRILFLDASDETLRRRREGDVSRSRNSFEHHLTHLLPLKRAWFIGRENVDVLNTDSLSAVEAGQSVKAWVDRLLQSNNA